MRILVVAVGTRMPQWVAAGFEEYARRMPRECRIELIKAARGDDFAVCTDQIPQASNSARTSTVSARVRIQDDADTGHQRAAASWPHAASMSWPRLLRTVACTPDASSRRWNASTRSSSGRA